MENERLRAALLYSEKLTRDRAVAARKARKSPPKIRRSARMSGFVYVVGCQEYIKIGIADNVKLRLSGLQTGCPFDLKLLAHWSCDKPIVVERRLHAMFRRFHIRGEWFKVPEDMLAIILTLKDITRLPP